MRPFTRKDLFLMAMCGLLPLLLLFLPSQAKGNQAGGTSISPEKSSPCRMFEITKPAQQQLRFRTFKTEEVVAVTLIKQDQGGSTFVITACSKE